MAPEPTARSKQTEETLQAVCENLRMGILFDRSCKLAGISKQSGHAWRRAGWAEIENEGEGSDADIPFVVRFALETELALGDFMRPLIEKMRAGGEGKAKSDWRAAASLLASRFPHEFSEKVSVAKFQKVELSGELAIQHSHEFAHFMTLRSMSRDELNYEHERLQSQIDNRPVKGEELDADISFTEAKLGAMREASTNGWGFVRANWLTSPTRGRPQPHTIIDHEATTERPAAATAPSETSEPGFVHRGLDVSTIPIVSICGPVPSE